MKTNASLSITTRLTLLYLSSTLLILVCVVGFLLRNMVVDLEREDNDYLDERLTSIQAIIFHYPHNLEALHAYMPTDDTNKPLRYLVRIQDATGAVLLESQGMAAIPSLQFPAPALGTNQHQHPVTCQGSDARDYLLNATWAEGDGDSHFRLVQVALDVTEELLLIRSYQIKMGIAVLVGLGIAGWLGRIISRKGLQPLEQMAATVTKITSTDLHQRVGSRSWPTELTPLTAALDTMLEQLEAAFSRLTEFSANLAHELRTPINNLRVEAEVALSRPRTAEEYRRTIESNTEEYERLTRMISNILFLARPEQGVQPQQLDLRVELETLVEYYQTLAEERQITLTINGSGTVVSADPRLFQRAVGNLIANALYYTHAGGHVTVTITPPSRTDLSIIVQDTGDGIAPEEVPLVFDRFYRTSQARQHRHDGSGLGLAIVRSIMELHGGSVTLTSIQGHGTTVTLVFPLR